MTLSRRLPSVVGIVFALGWPLVLALLAPNQNLANVRQDTIVVVCEWLAVVVLFVIVISWERLPFFSSIGLTRPQRTDWIAVGVLALAAICACAYFAAHHTTMQAKNTILGQVLAAPVALRALMVFTAGICEEILFRGYAIERLRALTGKVWLGALIATVLFTLGHIPRYGFSSGLAGVFIIGAILSLVYVWRRNLAACIALHWLIDGFSLLILPAFVTLK